MSTPKRAPCVNLRTDVHKDERFAALAQIAGFSRYEAVGRMHALWSWCIDRGLRDAPDGCDGYVVSAGVVRQFLGQSGEMALTAEGCDELALGVQVSSGRYYLRGTSEYVQARRQLVATSTAGGQARSRAERQKGRFVGNATIDQPAASRTPADSPADSSPQPADIPAETPAGTSVLPSSFFQEENTLSGKPDRVLDFARAAVAEINRLAGTSFEFDSKSARDMARSLLKAKHTEADALAVIHSKRDWLDKPDMRRHFCPSTLLGSKNFQKYLDDLKGRRQQEQTYTQSAERDEAVHPMMALFAEENLNAAS
jgi:uncharacterized phage protein (TIGR02220 family)